jgi:hypothetical protein
MKKSWAWFLVKALVALILVGLLVAGGFAIHYVSWSQGYATGQRAAEGEEVAEPPPYLYHGFRPSGRLGLVRPLMCAGGFLLLLVVVGGLFRALAWRRMWAYGPWAMHHHRWPRGRRTANWAKHWRRHGPMPPWCWDWDEADGADAEQGDATPDGED